MAGLFVVTRGGRDSFCTEEELKQRASAGQLANGDLVYHPRLGRWLYGREVEEVKSEMAAAIELGQPVNSAALVPANQEAIAGFILGVLGHLPLFGFACCLFGIYFSGRGIKRAMTLENSG